MWTYFLDLGEHEGAIRKKTPSHSIYQSFSLRLPGLELVKSEVKWQTPITNCMSR